MDDRRYQDVLEEHARLTRNPVRAIVLLLIGIALLGLIFGHMRAGALERYLWYHSYTVQ